MSVSTPIAPRRPRPPGPCAHPGPTLARVRLGSELRLLREAAGLTREEAAERIRASAPKISRLELGRTGFKQRDVADLLDLYGLAEGARRRSLLGLARQANAPAWWSPYREAIPSWFEQYLGLEQAATAIRCYEAQFIPGLLQTEDYARSVFQLSGQLSGQDVEQRVRLRMERQRILTRSDPPRLWAIVDEAALRRPVGGPAVMRGQLARLSEAAEERHITLQVLPFRAGGQPASGRPVTLLQFVPGELPDVVYLEHLDRAVYLSKPGDLAHYGHVLGRLAAGADPPIASALLLRHLAAGR